MRIGAFLGAFVAATLLAKAPAARAQAIEVAPVSVELAAGVRTTTLTVTNRDARANVVQARTFAWSQAGAEDTLTETRELVISPPIVELPQGQTQIIRLVIRKPATARESTYRILLDQLPPPETGSAIRMALRLSLPVFVEPDARVKPALDWRVKLDGRGGAELIAVNRGGRHARLLDPSLTTAAGIQVVVQPNINPYILAGAERRWRLSGDLTGLTFGSAARLTAKTDEGPVTSQPLSVGEQ